MEDKRVRKLQPYLVGYLDVHGGVYMFVFKKLSATGRILPKKNYVVPLGSAGAVWSWVHTTACLNEVNNALRDFGFNFQLDNIAVECRNGKYFFYHVYD